MARRDPLDRPAALPYDGSEAAVYRDRARRLGLPFAPSVTLARGTRVSLAAVHEGRLAISAGGDRAAYVAPSEDAMAKVAVWLAAHPSARQRLSVATRSAIRSGLIEAGATRFVATATRRLAARHPSFSAARVVTAGQAVAGLVVAAAIGVGLYAAPTATVIALNLIGAVLFFGVSVLRFIAAGLASRRRLVAQVFAPDSDDVLPVYTILVPLFHEAGMVRDLVAALDRIDWPGIR